MQGMDGKLRAKLTNNDEEQEGKKQTMKITKRIKQNKKKAIHETKVE